MSRGSELDYGLIGNCQISALVHRSGRIAWCCMPRPDSGSVFGSILDEERGGFWSVEPAGELGWSTSQEYLRNTNVLRTTFESAANDAAFEILDFCPRYFDRDHIHRPVSLVRILRPLRGLANIRVRCRPRPGYGAFDPRVSPVTGGLVYSTDGESFFLMMDTAVSYIQNESVFELRETVRMVFSYAAPFKGLIRFDVDEQLERTISWWRGWARHCSIPFEFQDEVLRSALALKLHIFEDTGAILAATTTSIPESPHSGRTWDYRYCWLRDAYFVITALSRLGHFDEIEHFIRYLQNICAAEAGRKLQPVYGIGGERKLVERELPWLKGFGGHGPVRVGNAAYSMEQHDVYGEMVLALTRVFFDRRMHRTDLSQAFQTVEQLVKQAIQVFSLPDAGIWEFRGTTQHSTFSKLMSWAAVDRGVRIARRLGRFDLVEQWEQARGEMSHEIHQKSWNEMVGYFSQSFGGDAPDAANLLLIDLGFLDPGDERARLLVDAYQRLLCVHGGVYRYRAPDDFGVPTSTFTICAFWMADALWAVGRKVEARALFESMIGRANHLGLLSEDIDAEGGGLWGNFPQTYSHVGLINTAWKISTSWED